MQTMSDEEKPSAAIDVAGVDVESGFISRVVAEPMLVNWSNLVYDVEIVDPKTKQKSMKRILNDVSAFARPGEVLCIMGGSGAGKSTLLNAIANRLQMGELAGSLQINDYPEDKYAQIVKGHGAYVLQEDLMLQTLTPRELFTYQARLLSKDLSRVDEVIRQLDLHSCENTLVQFISGGQKKRVSIGLGLLSDPSVLLLDEPTSGLDSFVAANLIQLLRKLAVHDRRTIVTTIHQPSSEIFATFDKFLLMDQGRIVFFGDAREATPYFASIGFPLPEGYNPADHFVSVTKKNDCSMLVEKFQASEYAAAAAKHKGEVPQGTGHAVAPVAGQLGFLSSSFILTAREFIAVKRDPMSTFVKMIQTIFFAVIIGLIYVPLGDNQKSIQNRAGAAFFIIVNQSFGSVSGVVFTFPKNKLVFIKEYRDGLFSSFAYYLSKGFADLPFQLISPLVFALISYFFVGFRFEADKFFIYLACLEVCSQVAVALGYVISAASKNGDIASAMTPAVMIPAMLFGGLFLNLDNVPYYFLPFKYVSFIFYGFQILMRNEFTGMTFRCSAGETVPNTNPPVCPVTDGDQVLNNYKIEIGMWECFVIMLALYVAFRALAYWALYRSANNGKGVKRVYNKTA
jgi:ABC-type multidrug transport system ATPase subunit